MVVGVSLFFAVFGVSLFCILLVLSVVVLVVDIGCCMQVPWHLSVVDRINKLIQETNICCKFQKNTNPQIIFTRNLKEGYFTKMHCLTVYLLGYSCLHLYYRVAQEQNTVQKSMIGAVSKVLVDASWHLTSSTHSLAMMHQPGEAILKRITCTPSLGFPQKF